jgi:hypothetical protein
LETENIFVGNLHFLRKKEFALMIDGCFTYEIKETFLKLCQGNIFHQRVHKNGHIMPDRGHFCGSFNA